MGKRARPPCARKRACGHARVWTCAGVAGCVRMRACACVLCAPACGRSSAVRLLRRPLAGTQAKAAGCGGQDGWRRAAASSRNRRCRAKASRSAC
eukprot:3636812-Pleurochrysis_carterae.AAC.1